MIETRQECQHLAYWRSLAYAPKNGERIWCEQCKDMRRVESRTGTWYAQCNNCSWHRALQDVQKLAEKVAAHCSDRQHAVGVWNHDKTVQGTARTSHAARKLVTDQATTRQKSKNGSRIALQQHPDTLF